MPKLPKLQNLHGGDQLKHCPPQLLLLFRDEKCKRLYSENQELQSKLSQTGEVASSNAGRRAELEEEVQKLHGQVSGEFVTLNCYTRIIQQFKVGC